MTVISDFKRFREQKEKAGGLTVADRAKMDQFAALMDEREQTVIPGLLLIGQEIDELLIETNGIDCSTQPEVVCPRALAAINTVEPLVIRMQTLVAESP